MELDRQWFYRGFRKALRLSLGRERAQDIWAEAGREYSAILAGEPALKRHGGAMVIPAVALYRAMVRQGVDGEALLNAYGDAQGRRFAAIVHAVTRLPGVSRWIWRHVGGIMERMSSERLGYRRRIVSRPPELYGVDILACPYHDLAKHLGDEAAVRCICHMDKAYMKGFCRIRYERTTAVSEGAECCDYRLRTDAGKH